MRVSEETQRPGRRLERQARIGLIEDVRIFVVRRPMADLDEIVDREWPLGQGGDPFAVFRRQGLERPLRGSRRLLSDEVPLRVVELQRERLFVARIEQRFVREDLDLGDRTWRARTQSTTALGSAP